MGNICRSPTAEEVLRAHARRAGLELHLDSAGTEDYHVGEPPDARSIHHASLRGYDLSGLRARQVAPEDFRDFDLILAADPLNLGVLRGRCPPEHHGKLALFLGDRALPDPYYGEASDFEKVLDLVEKRVVSLIAGWSRPTD
jgi:protein-tyrosine phosphatase